MTMQPSPEMGSGTRPLGIFVRRTIAACGAVALLASSVPASAAEHVLPRTKLHSAVAESQRATRENRDDLLRVLSAPQSQEALSAVGIEFKQVQQAVATLDDATAARLAERARLMDRDFAAGALSNETLTYIVIALATAVIVLVAVT